MTRLAPMNCACGRIITPRGAEIVRAASSYETCLYQCACGRGYSNSTNEASRTCIVRSPELNVPEQVREGLEQALAASLNTRNVPSKRSKFCFSSSEDAVTWTVFRWLEQENALSAVADVAGAGRPADEPSLLLWGAPTTADQALREELTSVLDGLREARTARSEPDVIVAWKSLLVIVEVKYTSSNDVKPGYPHFTRYLDRPDLFGAPIDDVTRGGLYELVRNWRFGVELAERTGRRFVLVNLGPRRLAAQTPGIGDLFANSDTRSFVSASWGDLLGAARGKAPFPTWLESYLAERELDSRWS